MAIVYSTGTATGANDLLDKLKLFVEANGWTINRHVVAGSGKELCISKDDMFFNLRSAVNETVRINGSSTSNCYGIALTGSDGYSAGLAWDLQPNYPQYYSNTSYACHSIIADNILGAISSYHFFLDTNYVYMEIEVSSGIWHRGGFGKLATFNTGVPGNGRFFYGSFSLFKASSSMISYGTDYSGGYEYIPFHGARVSASRTNNSSFLRINFGAYDNWGGSGVSLSSTHTAGYTVASIMSTMGLATFALGINPLNAVGILSTDFIGLFENTTNIKPVGSIVNQRLFDMGTYNPADTITIGATTWKIFPWYQKGGMSANRAIAHRLT